MDPLLTPASTVLAPYLPQDPLLIPAWLGCLSWALQDPEVLTAFRTATGNQWTPGRTPLARMIDTATGADQAFLVQFAGWLNVHLWGDV